eukprot:16431-Heterococcus_DN1.PRE.2
MQFGSVLCLCCCLAALLPADAFFLKRGSTRAVRTAKSCLELRGGQTLSPPMGHPKSKPLNPPAPAVDAAGDDSSSEEQKFEALRMDGFDIDNEDAHLYDDGDFDSYESSEEDESAAEGNSHANLQEVSDSD